jgi:hypothetical protein
LRYTNKQSGSKDRAGQSNCSKTILRLKSALLKRRLKIVPTGGRLVVSLVTARRPMKPALLRSVHSLTI